MKTLPKLIVLLVTSVILSCSLDNESVLPIAQLQNNTNPTAVVLNLDVQDCSSFNITWSVSTDDDPGDIIKYKVYINNSLAAEELTDLQYTTEVNSLSYPILVEVVAYDNNLGESDLSNTLQIDSPVSNNIVFTDPRLKKGLLANDTPIDLNEDDEISECEAFLFSGTLNLAKRNISSLNDLSYFVQSKVLIARDNVISETSVLTDLSFEAIDLNLNQISSFDMGANYKIKTLMLGYNQISSIDLSSYDNLEHVNLTDNYLTNIDLTNNPLLKILLLDNNTISQIDIFSNIELVNLGVSKNAISIIDVSNNINLERLDVSYTQIASLDLLQNTNLKQVFCNSTNVEQLDFSSQPFLEDLYCKQNSALTLLNLKNSNNSAMIQLFANQNSNLSCIEVDDINNIPINWVKDVSAAYSLNCN